MTGFSTFQRQLVAIVGSLLMSAITVGSAVGPAQAELHVAPVAILA